MGLRRKPHTLTLIPVSESKTGGRVDVPVEGTARNIACQITPLSSDQAFKTFGGDIDLKRPSLMLCDPSDGVGIKVGDRAVFNSQRYFVNAPPMDWGAGLATDCTQILLEMEQF